MISVLLTKFELRRLLLLWLGMFSGLILLVFSLWRVQIGMTDHYEVSLDRQSIRRVRIPGVRGRIFDRAGVCLADNRPSYGIAIYLEEIRQTGRRVNTVKATRKLIGQVAELIGLEPQITDRQIEDHLFRRRALPLAAWQDIGHGEMARLAEAGGDLRALDIIVDVDRIYPQGETAGHLLGYVGKLDEVDELEHYHYYLPDMEGRAGLERLFDDFLAGRAGGQLVRVDVAGFKYEEISARPAVAGGDLMLTIDLNIQRAVERVLEGTVGAAVVLDPSNGDVLALASAPALDPNWFTPVLPRTVWARLLNDKRKPLLNRAINGVYPPGSIFKPVVGLAALESGAIRSDTLIDCHGVFTLGNQRFACFNRIAHGNIALRRALEVSCNVFFYRVGLTCGIDAIHDAGRALGLGERTGIEAESEAAGLMPGREWKRRTQGEGWRDGDTCNVSIGQGAVLVTPLQMAVVTAAIANGGFVYRPRLILGRRRSQSAGFQEEPPVLLRKINWAPESLATVQAGMRDAIQSPFGTGRRAQVPGVLIAGKTGTAQFGPRQHNLKHGWMIAFAPADQPRYAVAIVMDEIATAGGAEVGPRMQQLLAEILTN